MRSLRSKEVDWSKFEIFRLTSFFLLRQKRLLLTSEKIDDVTYECPLTIGFEKGVRTGFRVVSETVSVGRR